MFGFWVGKKEKERALREIEINLKRKNDILLLIGCIDGVGKCYLKQDFSRQVGYMVTILPKRNIVGRILSEKIEDMLKDIQIKYEILLNYKICWPEDLSGKGGE